jgi:hypothetical protein
VLTHGRSLTTNHLLQKGDLWLGLSESAGHPHKFAVRAFRSPDLLISRDHPICRLCVFRASVVGLSDDPRASAQIRGKFLPLVFSVLISVIRVNQW